MLCPKCNSSQVFVIDSRPYGKITRRRKECQDCKVRFNTLEITEKEYKALQYEAGKIPIIQKKEEPEHNTVCRYCGKGFYTTKKIKVFCSDDCRIEHLKMKAKERNG